MVQRRHPHVAAALVTELEGSPTSPSRQRYWNSAEIKPDDLDTIGAEAWLGEGPKEDRALVVLGVPVGHRACVQKWLANKKAVTCAVSQSDPKSDPSGPRRAERMVALLDVRRTQAHHILRNLPPSGVSILSK